MHSQIKGISAIPTSKLLRKFKFIPILVYVSKSRPKNLLDGATRGSLRNIFNVYSERGLDTLFMNNYKQPLSTELTRGPRNGFTISFSSWKHQPNLAGSNAVLENPRQVAHFEVFDERTYSGRENGLSQLVGWCLGFTISTSPVSCCRVRVHI